MAITKTKFLNYSRCPRYIALENLKKEDLNEKVSYNEYQKEEEKTKVQELYQSIVEMEEENQIDNIEQTNKQLEAMLPYYKQVEEEAGKIIEKMFGGKSIYAEKTKDQMSFEFSENNICYLCYVDIYNETADEINIIEVKATTSKKYTDLKTGYLKGKKYSIFHKRNNIHYLKEEIKDYPLEEEMSLEKYHKERLKLFDRYKVGEYIHDLAVQRYFIENHYKTKNTEKRLKKIHYYLAVLNQNYIFDGTYQDGKAVYKTNNEEELITLFQLDEITKEYLKIIEKEKKNILYNLENPNKNPCPLSNSCRYKNQNCCKYFKTVCGKKIPSKNSSLNYVNNAFGFVKEDGSRIKGLELINEGYLNMLDVPESWITKKNHQIQRECLKNHQQYINKEKINAALKILEYPIYHLDFETFPCPLPRFKGEWPYIQSPFEFSLHIEISPGICDKEKDNIVFLAQTTNDERKKLIETLLKYIDPDKGTLFAQNVSFEKGRLKELANIFPEYKESLLKICERGFDLLYLVNNNKVLFEKLGFKDTDLETFNFYDENLSGSFSIKKTLPVFSKLSYKDLTVKNGTEAIIEYANYNKMTKSELENSQKALKIYCAQDTWAMVEILNALRNLVKI